MIEVSYLTLALVIEALVLLTVVVSVGIWMSKRNKGRDKKAIQCLVEQILHQSEIRLEKTGSFLSDKYRFEGNELSKAVKKIDTAEKLLYQKIINMYLDRDKDQLKNLDATVAELIDVYKSLSPVMPTAEEMQLISENPESTAESGDTEALQQEIDRLKDELRITKETMGNMISEFSNMFGGGSDNSIEEENVIEKISDKNPTNPQDE